MGSFKHVDLWRCSVEAGSNQTFDEFCGFAPVLSDSDEKAGGGGTGRRVLTCGSVLMLDVGKHLNLVEDYYAPDNLIFN